MGLEEPLQQGGDVHRIPSRSFRMLTGGGDDGGADLSDISGALEPLDDESARALVEAASESFSASKDLFSNPALSSPEAFKTFSATTQALIVAAGMTANMYSEVAELQEFAKYDINRQLQGYLAQAIEEHHFFTAKSIVTECSLAFSDRARASLLSVVEPVLHAAPWRQRESVADLIYLANPTKWQEVANDKKEQLVAVALSVEKIAKAHFTGTLLGFSDEGMREATVSRCLHEGRVELASAVANHFRLPLQKAEIERVSTTLKDRVAVNGAGLEIARVTSILDAYCRDGRLSIESLPECAGELDPGALSPLILLSFRGRTFAHIGAAEGGHPGTFDAFREHLVRHGFAATPTMLGGTHVHRDGEEKMTVLGASSTYGACDREEAGKILRRALPEYVINVRHDFPEIKN